MAKITLKQAAAWCGGTVDEKYENVEFYGANNDTRIIREGQLFIVLQGARDGHDFIPMAIQKGAAAVLCSRKVGDYWVVEPRFAEFGVPENGYIPCTDIPGDQFLVDLETGKIVYKAQSDAVVQKGVGSAVLLYSDGYYWLENFYGAVIVPPAARIQIADDDRDGTPELFVATNQNGDVVYYEPDGAERLRICGAGAVETVSSDFAVYTRTVQEEATGEWTVDFALIDLQTGQGNREFEKPYTRASRVYGETVQTDLFYAWYEDSAGVSRVDLLDSSGTVLLEDLQIFPGTEDQYVNGDVFLTAEGYRCADGTWLYRFE